MAIDVVWAGEIVLQGDKRRTAPLEESSFDLRSVGMVANDAFPLVALRRRGFAFREAAGEARAFAVCGVVKFAMRNCHGQSSSIDANTREMEGQLNDGTVVVQD
jgi:hypothetical protein